MKTQQNKYKNVNYKLNDLTRKKTKDISKYNKPNNINNNKKRYVSLKEKDIERKKNNNLYKSIKINDNKNLSKNSQISNNSLMSTREGISIKNRSEIRKLNQTQENLSSRGSKVNFKKIK